MNREVHVRFCEGLGVKFPRATRPLIHTLLKFNLAQDVDVSQCFTDLGSKSNHIGRVSSVCFELEADVFSALRSFDLRNYPLLRAF